MQKQKDTVKQDILTAAETIFLRKGFAATTMREIAKEAHVGLSNIYNYFHNKDEIYSELLKPLLKCLYAKVYEHDPTYTTLRSFTDQEYRRKEAQDYLTIAARHRRLLKLLLFHSQGSSLADFRQAYTDKMTEVVSVFFKGMKEKYPQINIEVSRFFLHLNTSWLLTLMEELITHRIGEEEMEQFVTEYVRFEMAGWRELLEIERM